MYLSDRKCIVGLLIFFTLIATVMAVAAQDIQYPTYDYYGKVLSADEFLKLIETQPEISIGCTPLPNVELYTGDSVASIDYVCFNTKEELQTHIDEVLDPQWERIAQEHPAYQPEPHDAASDNSLRSDHWALYANSIYTAPHLGDVYNGTTCYSTSSGVWSAWKDGNPNTLYLYRYTNCTSNPYYTYTSALSSCVFSWPLGCGGSQGAKVP